jgi:hypothetical protein
VVMKFVALLMEIHSVYMPVTEALTIGTCELNNTKI